MTPPKPKNINFMTADELISFIEGIDESSAYELRKNLHRIHYAILEEGRRQGAEERKRKDAEIARGHLYGPSMKIAEAIEREDK